MPLNKQHSVFPQVCPVPSQTPQPTVVPKPVQSVIHVPLQPGCPGRGKMAKFLSPEEMTSRDYYFDSYAHFGIHEVIFIFYLSNYFRKTMKIKVFCDLSFIPSHFLIIIIPQLFLKTVNELVRCHFSRDTYSTLCPT